MLEFDWFLIYFSNEFVWCKTVEMFSDEFPTHSYSVLECDVDHFLVPKSASHSSTAAMK